MNFLTLLDDKMNGQPYRIVRCPSCGKTSRYDETNPNRPFCCERCKTYDISQWADEKFRIPLAHNEQSSEDTLSESEDLDSDDNS